MNTPLELLRGWHKGKDGGKTSHKALEAALARPGVEVNAADPDSGYTALHYACVLKDAKAIQCLLTTPNIDPGVRDADNMTPLLLLLTILGQDFVWGTEFTGLVEAARALCRHPGGAVAVLAPSGCSPLSLVLELCRKLGELYRGRRLFEELDRSTSKEIPVRAESNRTAVMVCVQLNWASLLETLLQYQKPLPDLHAVDQNGMTALHIAGKLGHRQCMELIIKKDSSLCNIKDENGNIALFYLVVKLQGRECLNFLSTFPTCWDFTAVNSLDENILDYYGRYAEKNHEQEVENALWTHSGVDKKSKRSKGWPRRDRDKYDPKASINRDPVKKIEVLDRMQAAAEQSCERPLGRYLISMKKVEALFKLIAENSGLTVDQFDRKGYTVLMSAAMNGLEEETEALLQARPRPDVNKISRQGETALHMAAKYGRVGVFQILCSHPNIDVNLADSHGNTPLFYILEKFPRKEALTFIGGDKCKLKWNFRVKNNSMLMPGDYYKKCLRERPYNMGGKVDKKEEDRMIVLLKQCGSIRRPAREPVQQDDGVPSMVEGEDSGVSDSSSARSSSSSRDSKDSDTSIKTRMRDPPGTPVQASDCPGDRDFPSPRAFTTMNDRRPQVEPFQLRCISQTVTEQATISPTEKRKAQSFDSSDV